MKPRSVAPLVVSCSLVLFVAIAQAQRHEPAKATKVQVWLATAYEPCGAPSITLGSAGLPACVNALPQDPLCFFTSRGKGKVQLKVRSGDVSVRTLLSGIDPTCAGETLCPTATLRISSDNCSSGPDCTAPDLAGFPLGCCTVTGTRCEVSSTLSAMLPGVVTSGDNAVIGITDVEVVRSSSIPPGAIPFRASLLIP